MNILNETLKGLKFSFHLIVHPFDGFWDLKKEKRGNFWSACAIIFFLIVIIILKTQVTGFLVNFADFKSISLIQQILSVIVPFFLWCISNWCITTLMDGEGSFKDIAITTAYALVPIILLNIPLLLISNVITNEEASFYFMINSVAIGWSAFLVFVGIMTVHQFSVFKTILTILIAIIGMAVIMFLALLFVSVMQQVLAFTMVLYKEIALRK